MKLGFMKCALLNDCRILRFLLSGMANTLVGALMMFLLYNLGNVSYWISSAASYIAGGILSFFLNKFFTFKNTQKSIRQIILFAINLIVCYLIAYICAKKIVFFALQDKSEKIRGNAALFCAMCAYTVLNYIGQRFFVFKINESEENI